MPDWVIHILTNCTYLLAIIVVYSEYAHIPWAWN